MLRFKERGRGPALVFIHAFPLDSAMWDAQAAFFADRYRVITPDVIGFGDSLPAVPWNMAGMGEELSALLDHLGVKTCALAGLCQRCGAAPSPMGSSRWSPWTTGSPWRALASIPSS